MRTAYANFVNQAQPLNNMESYANFIPIPLAGGIGMGVQLSGYHGNQALDEFREAESFPDPSTEDCGQIQARIDRITYLRQAVYTNAGQGLIKVKSGDDPWSRHTAKIQKWEQAKAAYCSDPEPSLPATPSPSTASAPTPAGSASGSTVSPSPAPAAKAAGPSTGLLIVGGIALLAVGIGVTVLLIK